MRTVTKMLLAAIASGALALGGAACSHVAEGQASYYDWRAERNAKAGNYGTAEDYQRRAAQKRQQAEPPAAPSPPEPQETAPPPPQGP